MNSELSTSLHRFRRSVSGNVTMIFALGAPVLCFAVAMAVDFNNATIVRSKLNAAADAAALAALTPAMMANTDAVARPRRSRCSTRAPRRSARWSQARHGDAVTSPHPNGNGSPAGR